MEGIYKYNEKISFRDFQLEFSLKSESEVLKDGRTIYKSIFIDYGETWELGRYETYEEYQNLKKQLSRVADVRVITVIAPNNIYKPTELVKALIKKYDFIREKIEKWGE